MPIRSPQDVGRLPSPVTGDFNSIGADSSPQRLSVAGTLPSSLPGNFNNIRPEVEAPYGSIGFSLICRSVKDFTTVLGIFYDYLSMSFSEELNAFGAGSVSFDLDDPTFLNQLVNTDDPDDITAKDNLWEVYFDGKRKFMWIGQNVSDSKVNSNETNTVTISGPGLASTLDWAKVFPNRFPEPYPPLSDLTDDFIDQDLDVYGKWSKSVSSIGSITPVNAEVQLSVSGTGTPGTYIASDYVYDFDDSGTSVLVTPYVGATGAGYVKTYVRIEASDVDYVGMFVDKVGSSYVLKAEAIRPDGTYASVQVPYVNNNSMRYWRIQELDGSAVFSYKDLDASDDEYVVFATLPYRMDPSKVRLKLWVIAVAGTGLTLPQKSRFAQLSTSGVASALPPFERFRRLILKAQARGAIRHVIPDWSSSADSMGAAWVDSVSAEPSVGVGLASVLEDVCKSNRADWLFTADYRLQIRQRVYVMDGTAPDPTAPYHKEDKVIFYEEESQVDKQKTTAFSGVANYLVGSTSNGQYAVEYDDSSIGEYQHREEFISDTTTATDEASLRASLRNQLEDRKEGATSWTLQVDYDVEGKRLYKDYVLGDWVGVQTVGTTSQVDSWRIAAIAVSVGGDGDPNIELTLNSKFDPHWIKLSRVVEKNKWRRPIDRKISLPYVYTP